MKYTYGDRIKFLRFGRLFTGKVEETIPGTNEYVVLPDKGGDEILVSADVVSGKVGEETTW